MCHAKEILATPIGLCNAGEADIIRAAMPTTIRTLSRLMGAGLLVMLGAGCALLPSPADAPEDPPEEPSVAIVPEPVEPPEPPEPVLTVPEVYEAISLSVQAGDPVAAISAYQEAEIADPDDPMTQVLLANLFLIAGESEHAAAILEEVLDSDTENTEAMYLLSLIRGASDDTTRQRGLLDRILELDPGHTRARAALGELLLQGRSFRAAAAAFEQVIEDDPDNLVARVGLGNVYLRQRRYADAEEQLTAAIEIDPDNSFGYSDRARARALQYYLNAADSDLTVAIELDPDHYWHYIDRGRVRMESRRFPAAVADFTAAISLDDELFLGYVLRAQANDALERIEDALVDYREALRRRPDYAPAFAPLGVILYMLEEYDSAADYLRRAFEREPRRYDLALLSALSLKSADRNREAVGFLNGIINTVPRDSLYYEMMRYYVQAAGESLVITRLRDSTDRTLRARMYFYLGARLELLGRVQTAQASFLEAEEKLQPGFIEQRLAAWRLRTYRSGEEHAGE